MQTIEDVIEATVNKRLSTAVQRGEDAESAIGKRDWDGFVMEVLRTGCQLGAAQVALTMCGVDMDMFERLQEKAENIYGDLINDIAEAARKEWGE